MVTRELLHMRMGSTLLFILLMSLTCCGCIGGVALDQDGAPVPDAADIQGYKVEVDRRFDDSANIEIVIAGYHVSKVTSAPSQGPVAPGLPSFDVQRTGPTAVQVRLVSFGSNTTSPRGSYVKTPAIKTQEVILVDQPLTEEQTIVITDPELSGTVDFVASSRVNGNYAEVVNTTI